jgi:hypothetical protein
MSKEESKLDKEQLEILRQLIIAAADRPIAEKDLGNGRRLTIFPMTFGKARLGIGPVDMGCNDDEW